MGPKPNGFGPIAFFVRSTAKKEERDGTKQTGGQAFGPCAQHRARHLGKGAAGRALAFAAHVQRKRKARNGKKAARPAAQGTGGPAGKRARGERARRRGISGRANRHGAAGPKAHARHGRKRTAKRRVAGRGRRGRAGAGVGGRVSSNAVFVHHGREHGGAGAAKNTRANCAGRRQPGAGLPG